MSNSTIFKQAHTMTKQVIQLGDNYQVTFGACLKSIIAESKKAVFIQSRKDHYNALAAMKGKGKKGDRVSDLYNIELSKIVSNRMTAKIHTPKVVKVSFFGRMINKLKAA